MNDQAVDTTVLYERLRHIRELLDDLDQIGDLTADELAAHRINRHAVERIITQVVDLAVSINSHLAAAKLGRGPATYRASFGEAAQAGAIEPDLADELAPAAGMRNVLTHDYVAVDLAKVEEAIPEVRAGFRRYVRAVARYVQDLHAADNDPSDTSDQGG